MLFELINPSDPYTFYADDLMVASVAVVILGEGKYSAVEMGAGENKKSVPLFLFGMNLDWFDKTFGMNFEQVMKKVRDEKKKELIDCLRSFVIGSYDKRVEYDRAIEYLNDQSDIDEYRNNWNNKYRSSLNDIGGYASEFANAIS